MNAPRALPAALVVLAVCALVAVTVLFTRSLGLTEATKARLPRVAVPKLLPGQYAFVAHPQQFTNDPVKLLFVRSPDGSLNVWLIPMTADGRTALPDGHWWRRGRACSEFRPNDDFSGFACFDRDAPEFVRAHLRWSISGKSLDPQVASDMIRVNGYEETGDYVLTSYQGG